VNLVTGGFLALAAQTSVAILAAYVWTVSGAYALRQMQYLGAFAHSCELRYPRCRIRESLLVDDPADSYRWAWWDPRQWLEDDEDEFREMQEHYEEAVAAAPDFSTFVDRETERIRSVPEILVSLAADDGFGLSADLGEQVEAAITETLDAVFAAPDPAAIRATDKDTWRRTRGLLVGFLRGARWHPLGLELLDYVGRGTAAGLLLGVLLPVGPSELDRIALGAAVGGGLSIVLWQRAKVRRLVAAYLAIWRSEGWMTVLAHRVARHPGLAVIGVYAVFAALDALILLLRVAAEHLG
jgi:hypothetical protein